MDTTKPQKEPLTCEGCGLEAIEDVSEDLCIIVDNVLENAPYGLTDDQIADLIDEAIEKAIDQSEVGEELPVKHLPAYPSQAPCRWCERNPDPDIDIMTDFFSENWTCAINQGKVKAFFEDPTQRDKALLRLLKYAEKFYGGEKHG